MMLRPFGIRYTLSSPGPIGDANPNSGVFTALFSKSGAAGTLTHISVGRTGYEASFGIAAATNQWFTGTAAGDTAYAYGVKAWFGTGDLDTGGAVTAIMDANNNVVIGGAAIATTATNGFLYIPTCAGTPTGTPTTYTGRAPMVYDSTNNKLYIYNGGWKSATFA